jgi:hypothetical protein
MLWDILTIILLDIINNGAQCHQTDEGMTSLYWGLVDVLTDAQSHIANSPCQGKGPGNLTV